MSLVSSQVGKSIQFKSIAQVEGWVSINQWVHKTLQCRICSQVLHSHYQLTSSKPIKWSGKLAISSPKSWPSNHLTLQNPRKNNGEQNLYSCRNQGLTPRYKMYKASGAILQVILFLPTIEMACFLGTVFLLLFSHVVMAADSIILLRMDSIKVNKVQVVGMQLPSPVLDLQEHMMSESTQLTPILTLCTVFCPNKITCCWRGNSCCGFQCEGLDLTNWLSCYLS